MEFDLSKEKRSDGKRDLLFIRKDGKKANVGLTDQEIYDLAELLGSKSISLDDYQQEAKSTCTDNSYSYSYLSAGMMEEVGEYFGKIAKMVRKGELPINFTREDILNLDADKRKGLMLEAGDILWFAALLNDWCGWKLSDVAEANLAKLAERKARGTIVGEGDNR